MAGHTSKVNFVAFSHDGKRVVSGSNDWTVCVWDSETGAICSGPFEEHDLATTSVAFSQDGKRVARAQGIRKFGSGT